MRLEELALEYRAEAAVLKTRILLLEEQQRHEPDRERRFALESRLRPLREMLRDVRDVAVLLERYYERGYRRNGRYTL